MGLSQKYKSFGNSTIGDQGGSILSSVKYFRTLQKCSNFINLLRWIKDHCFPSNAQFSIVLKRIRYPPTLWNPKEYCNKITQLFDLLHKEIPHNFEEHNICLFTFYPKVLFFASCLAFTSGESCHFLAWCGTGEIWHCLWDFYGRLLWNSLRHFTFFKLSGNKC